MEPDFPIDLHHLSYLNGREEAYRDAQKVIDKARRKYFDVPAIQLDLDRRQTELDKLKKKLNEEKGQVLNPN